MVFTVGNHTQLTGFLEVVGHLIRGIVPLYQEASEDGRSSIPIELFLPKPFQLADIPAHVPPVDSRVGEALLQAFATVFPAELPDKTMLATIVLVARYRRPGVVWLGAVSAFLVHVVVAMAAGKALSLLPDTVVKVVVAILFGVGAVLLFRAGRNHEEVDESEARTTAGWWPTFEPAA